MRDCKNVQRKYLKIVSFSHKAANRKDNITAKTHVAERLPGEASILRQNLTLGASRRTYGCYYRDMLYANGK